MADADPAEFKRPPLLKKNSVLSALNAPAKNMLEEDWTSEVIDEIISLEEEAASMHAQFEVELEHIHDVERHTHEEYVIHHHEEELEHERKHQLRLSEKYDQDGNERVLSYKDVQFESEEMRVWLRNREDPDEDNITGSYESAGGGGRGGDHHNSSNASSHGISKRQKYRASVVFPDWLLKSAEWKSTKGKHHGNDISEILRIPLGQRTPEQNSALIYWLMGVRGGEGGVGEGLVWCLVVFWVFGFLFSQSVGASLN